MSIFKTLGMKNPGVTLVNKLAPKLSTKADILASKNPALPKGRARAPSSKATSAAPKPTVRNNNYSAGPKPTVRNNNYSAGPKPTVRNNNYSAGFKNGGTIKKAGKK